MASAATPHLSLSPVLPHLLTCPQSRPETLGLSLRTLPRPHPQENSRARNASPVGDEEMGWLTPTMSALRAAG